MKMHEIVNEGYYDIDPKFKPFVEAGQKIMSGLEPSSGVKWPDDEEWNNAAKLGQQLVSLGDTFGAKSVADAIKKAGIDVDQAKAIIAKTKHLEIGVGTKDVEPEPEEVEDSICQDCGNPSWRTVSEEKQKGVDGKVCWKGYKRMGTKKKGGKTVDNCVKMEEVSTNTMADQLEKIVNSEGEDVANPKPTVTTDDGKEHKVLPAQAETLSVLARTDKIKPNIRSQFQKDIQTSAGLEYFLSDPEGHPFVKSQQIVQRFKEKYLK